MSFGIKKKPTSGNLVTIKPGSCVVYEQHGKTLLAAAISERKGKWSLLNQSGGSLQLASSRLFLLPCKISEDKLGKNEVSKFLQELNHKAESLETAIDLEESWKLLLGEIKEISPLELCKLIYGEDKANAAELFAVRRALAKDKIFFKRKKTTFEPRNENVVAELKIQAKVLEEKQRAMQILMDCILTRLKDPTADLPKNIKKIEEVAALGKQADNDKKVAELLEQLEEKANLKYKGKIESKAFELLVAIGHFSPIENLIPIKMGRPTLFSNEEENQAKNIDLAPHISSESKRIDLREISTVTIDGKETLDFDDAISIEQNQNGEIRVGVHIADVAAVIDSNSALNKAAMRRGTSIYCPDQIYPMFPISASEQTLSLKEGVDRPVLSYFMHFNELFEMTEKQVKRSIIRVDHRLSYEEVDNLLFAENAENTQLRDKLDLLWQTSSALEIARLSNGAQQFDRREMIPKVDEKGKVSLTRNEDDTPARKLVSEFMILSNETAAIFARDNNIPLYFRSQEKPEDNADERMYKVPEGPAREYAKRGTLKRSIISTSAGSHAALGLEAYAQTTSPIRRIVDLINQRQITYFIETGKILNEGKELEELQEKFSTGLSEAARIQRSRTRFWLLKYLQQEKISSLEATIVKIDGPKPIAEVEKLFSLFAFHPLNAIDLHAPEALEILGKQITLKIEKLNPMNDRFVLKEIEE